MHRENFLLQNDTLHTLGQSQLGRTLAAIRKSRDITVTYSTVAHFIFAFSFPSRFHLDISQLILQNEA